MSLLEQLTEHGVKSIPLEQVNSFIAADEFVQSANPIVNAQMHKHDSAEEAGKHFVASGFYSSFRDLLDDKVIETEEILLGIRRQEVALVISSTNIGKTTLILNTALSACAGQTCLPLLPGNLAATRRKIAYFDFEATRSVLRSDVNKMLRKIENREATESNFITVVDATIGGEPLNFTNAVHLQFAVDFCKENNVDIAVFDTLSASFDLINENDNAEVKRKIMRPLKQFAIEANCAVIAVHHKGKRNENDTNEESYSGRGASAFGALARTVYTLTKDKQKGEGYIVLTLAKSKGAKMQPTLLHLNPETRWFETCSEQPIIKVEPPTAEEIRNFVSQQQMVTTSDIQEYFHSRAGKRTISERIKVAEGLKLIEKESKYAPWKVCATPIDELSAPSF